MVDIGGPVVVSIGDMIDLAIGTPEVGVVDFNMLQTLLHCLAQQLRILGKNVELRGSVASLPVLRDTAQTIAVTEFPVALDSKKSRTPRSYEEAKQLAAANTHDSILVVERVRKEASTGALETLGGGRGGAGARGGGGARGAGAGAGGAAAGAGGAAAGAGTGGIPETLSLVTVSKFNILQDTVRDLKKRVYGSMPKNEDILDEVRSQTNLKSITDMWTNLNVSSRLEAAENGIAKLSSLVEDLIGETVDLQRRASQTQDPEKRSRPTTPARSAGGGKSSGGRGSSPAALLIEAGPNGLTADDLKGLQDFVNVLRNDLDDLIYNFNKAMNELLDQELLGGVGGGVGGGGGGGRGGDEEGLDRAGSGIDQGDMEDRPERKIKGDRTGAAPIERRHSEIKNRAALAALMERVGDLEKQLKDTKGDANRHIGQLTDHVGSMDEQLQYLMKQVAGVSGDLTDGKLSPDLIKDLKGLMELFSTVQGMQDQLKQVHETAMKLAAEKEDRQHHINALLEQIELLKAIKMDREDMAEAMAEKADIRALARKVSHDQFDMACDDLSRGLETAIGKLNMQEALWQQALDDIQREIETKLDKMELSPVKDFFNSKLKQLQESLKQMASLRREVEAAGTKRRLLRDVNCISCDANAVMQTETTVLPSSKPLPPTLSMKPYLSYELDAIRKAQASNVPQRNMHDWENIDKQMQPIKPLQKVRSETDKHLCNRYCGGSHTVTTPAQRVARLGHFVKQWGPDVLPLSSGLAAGDDGRMYKVITAENATVGPGGAVDAAGTPRTPTKRDSKPIQRPIVISAECRCLEGDSRKE